MTPNELFNQTNESHIVPYDAKLQSAFQFGVFADELAYLVMSGKKNSNHKFIRLI